MRTVLFRPGSVAKRATAATTPVVPALRSSLALQARIRPSRIFHTSNRTSGQRQRHQRQEYQRFNQGSGRNTFSLWETLRRWPQRRTFYREVAILGAAGGGFYYLNLEEVPVSGRRRFNMVGPAWEAQLAGQQYKMVLRDYNGRTLPEYDRRVVQVRRVLERLIPQSGLSANKEWTVNVINSDEPNAFVMPGNHVFVFTGILPICEDDDGLATVLGHEIGHNVAHHVAEQLSQRGLLLLLSYILEIGGINREITSPIFDLGLQRPGSRKQESEADYIGLMMMASSCYDPAKAVTFWNRMQDFERKNGGSVPQFLSTHPSSNNREAKLKEWLPKARDHLYASRCGRTGSWIDEFRQVNDLDKWA